MASFLLQIPNAFLEADERTTIITNRGTTAAFGATDMRQVLFLAIGCAPGYSYFSSVHLGSLFVLFPTVAI